MLNTLKRKLAVLGASLSVGALAAPLAFAQGATCTLNGESVPCEELGQAAAGFLGFGIAFMIGFFVIGVLSFVFWLMMIIHAAKHDIEHKAMWIVLQVLLGVIGSIVYYFAVKRNFVETPVAAMPAQAPAAAMPVTAPSAPAEPMAPEAPAAPMSEAPAASAAPSEPMSVEAPAETPQPMPAEPMPTEPVPQPTESPVQPTESPAQPTGDGGPSIPTPGENPNPPQV